MYDKSRPREGETKSQCHLSFTHNKPKEENNIGVLTIPNDLCKKKQERLTKELVENQDYHF